jgi:hypothetical protein
MGERSKRRDPKWADPIRIITAHPGWFVLQPIIGEDDSVKGLQEMPVIAWAVHIARFLDPNFLDPEEYTFNAIPIGFDKLSTWAVRCSAWAVRSPTGDLFLSHGQRFSTEQELIKHFATLRAFERERGYPHGR